MADATAEEMVLRTIHLPVELDRKLTSLAFSRSIPGDDLVLDLIREALSNVRSSGERTLAERVDAQAAGTVGDQVHPVQKPTAAQIEKSITPDALISFIDGKPYKTLKRHLTTHGLDIESYRRRYGLPSDYPTVSANYSAARSALAKNFGLGQQRRSAETKGTVAEAPARAPHKAGRRRKSAAA